MICELSIHFNKKFLITGKIKCIGLKLSLKHKELFIKIHIYKKKQLLFYSKWEKKVIRNIKMNSIFQHHITCHLINLKFTNLYKVIIF